MKNFYETLTVVISMIVFPLLAGGFMLNLIKKEEVALISLKIEVSSLEKNVFNIKNLKDLLLETEENRRQIEEVFVEEKELVRVIEDLEKMADLSGVELNVQSAQLSSNAEELGPLFNLRISGKFENIFRYLRLIENAPYQTKLEEVNLNKGLNPQEWNASYDIRIISYVF